MSMCGFVSGSLSARAETCGGHGVAMTPDLFLESLFRAVEQVAEPAPDEGFHFEVFGQRIRLRFVRRENGVRLLLTATAVGVLLLLRWLASGVAALLQRRVDNDGVRFWTRQAINLAFALLLPSSRRSPATS